MFFLKFQRLIVIVNCKGFHSLVFLHESSQADPLFVSKKCQGCRIFGGIKEIDEDKRSEYTMSLTQGYHRVLYRDNFGLVEVVCDRLELTVFSFAEVSLLRSDVSVVISYA